MTRPSGLSISGACMLVPLALLPAPAFAQLDEIVVTAQKREQTLQEVGMAVSALSGEQLEQLGATNTTDIVQQVPGLRLSTWTPAFTTFGLRGVSQNNFQDNLEAPVAVYFDDAYVASMNALSGQMFDMRRVEVLRGPQGTLFGRNATGGIIHFISRRADEEEFNGYLQGGVAQFNTYSMEGAVGGGVSERVRGRLAGRFEKSDGYLKAGTAFGVPATGGTSQGADGLALRGALQFDVTESLQIDLLGRYAKDDHVPTGQYVVTLAGFDPETGLGRFADAYNTDPEDPDNLVGPQDYPRVPITGDVHRHASNENPYYDRETVAFTAQVKAALGGVEIVSITNWLSLDKFYIEDAGGGFGFFPYTTVADFDQWSQELRVSGGQDRLRWQAGGYFLDMGVHTWQRVEGALLLGGTSDSQKVTTIADIDSRNYSVFAQVEYDLTDRLAAIGGLRWSQDDKHLRLRREYEDIPNGIPPTETYNIVNSTVPGIDAIDYGDYAVRAQLNFKVDPDNLLYFSFNRGIKGGNWSIDTLGAVADEDLKHNEEVLNAFEIGWKADLANGMARLNAAAFYYDYQGYQAFSLTNLVPQVTNANARAKGVEAEFSMSPLTGLDVTLGGTLMSSSVDAVPDVFGGTVKAELPLAPEFSANLLVRYEWPAFQGSLSAQVDGQWNNSQYLEGTNSEVSREPGYSVWNLRFGWTSADSGLNATVFARNLFDEEYRLYNLDLGLLGFVQQAYGPPRQIGVTVGYRW